MSFHQSNVTSSHPPLSMAALVAYGLVFIIPISPVAIYGYVNSDSHGMVSAVYLLGAVAMLFTALSYRKMSQLYPVGGSVFSYVTASVGEVCGFITGWIVLMDYILIPALVYRLSAAWVQDVFPGVPAWAWIVGIALINTLINCRGIVLTTRMSFILLSVQLMALISFLVCAGYYLSYQHDIVTYTHPFYQADYFNIHFIGTALSLALLNYLGFDGISTLAEETNNPKKMIGNAIILVLLLITVLFMLQTYTAGLVGQSLSLNKETAFFDITYTVGGPILYGIFIVVNIVSIGIASALVTQAASARLLNVMARNRVLPFARTLGKLHARYQTPTAATWLSGLLAVLFSLSFYQESLIGLVSWGGLTAYLILNYSVMHHFFLKKETSHAWFSTLLFPFLGMCLVAFVWLHFSHTTLLIGALFILLGLGLYWRQRKRYS